MLKPTTERAIVALRSEPMSTKLRETEAEEMAPEVFNARFGDHLASLYYAAQERMERARWEVKMSRQTMSELEAYVWSLRGDERGVNWDDPRVRADYARRFAQWLEEHPAIFCDWQDAALCFEDLFEKS